MARTFLRHQHRRYLLTIDDKTETLEYFMTEHLRLGGAYWCTTALALLEEPADRADEIVAWILRCQSASGGFGFNEGHDAHITATHYAVLILALYDHLGDLDGRVVEFLAGMQRPDGSFQGDEWGEIDTRFAYDAIASLTILGELDRVNAVTATAWLLACRNHEGAFGPIPGSESHAAFTFCAVAALALLDGLDLLDADDLGWWLCERQTRSGGFNGRPEKAPDVCYSWWILSTLRTIGRLSWVDGGALASFILASQDEDGGIADRPECVPDAFHTFFGLCGLSLLNAEALAPVHPVYALPWAVIDRMQLPQIVDRCQLSSY